jgi:DNA-binding PadR family transcriptional regulator
MARRRLGTSTLAILRALADGHRYGFDIMDVTGLPGGTVYPALAKLESDRLVSSNWEDPAVAQEEKRPPRRYYALSAAGEERLRTELAWLAGALADTAGARS